MILNVRCSWSFTLRVLPFDLPYECATQEDTEVEKVLKRLAVVAALKIPADQEISMTSPASLRTISIDVEGNELLPEFNQLRRDIGAYDNLSEDNQRNINWLRVIRFCADPQEANLIAIPTSGNSAATGPLQFRTTQYIEDGQEITLAAPEMFSTFLLSTCLQTTGGKSDSVATRSHTEAALVSSPSSGFISPNSLHSPGSSDQCSDSVLSSPGPIDKEADIEIDVESPSAADSTIAPDTTPNGTVRRRKRKQWLSCEICSKTFDRPSLLHRHLRTHTGERPFQCRVCNKAFSTSSSLNTHARIHSGEKPHKCQICGKSFTASSNLYYHRLTHVKIKPHQCNECEKSFATPGDLRSHIQAHRRIEQRAAEKGLIPAKMPRLSIKREAVQPTDQVSSAVSSCDSSSSSQINGVSAVQEKKTCLGEATLEQKTPPKSESKSQEETPPASEKSQLQKTEKSLSNSPFSVKQLLNSANLSQLQSTEKLPITATPTPAPNQQMVTTPILPGMGHPFLPPPTIDPVIRLVTELRAYYAQQAQSLAAFERYCAALGATGPTAGLAPSSPPGWWRDTLLAQGGTGPFIQTTPLIGSSMRNIAQPTSWPPPTNFGADLR